MPKYQYLIENSDSSTPGSLILILRPKSAQDVFNFKPGQYAMLSFYNQKGKFFINHPFSIASSPNQNGFLMFGIKILGNFTQNIQKLTVGSQVDVMGPFGDFVFEEQKHQEAVFLAGGVGITPFISASEYATYRHLSNRLTLLYSCRTVKEALFYDYIKKLAGANSNFTAKLKITQETLNSNFEYCENGYITPEVILENVGSVVGKDFFICGPGAFMTAMETNLLSLGVSRQKIHQEAFSVVPNLSFRKNFKNIFLVYGLAVILFLFFLSFIRVSATVTAKKTSDDTVDIEESEATSTKSEVSSKKVESKITTPKTNNLRKTTVPVTPKIVAPQATVPAVVTPTVSLPTVVVPPVSQPIYTPAPAPTPRTRTS
ncbi:MAG: FAD-binding oxidoreductase [Candidatus Falkowbacteria bacterium]